MPANLENSAEAKGLEKVNFHSNLKKGNAKECLNYHTIVLISHASKVMLKILQGRLQQYVNQEFQMYKLGLRKGRGTRNQIANIHWIIEKARELQKISTSASLTMQKLLTMRITSNYEKFLRRWIYQATLPVSYENCMQVKKQQLEPYMEQQTSSKLGKEYDKAVYCHSVYLTYMQITVLGAAVDGVTKSQNILCKMLGWMNHKL